MKEAELKLAVSDYLEYGTNQGRWYADRLNSGEVIVVAGEGRRRIKLCREGTADFMVLKYGRVPYGRNKENELTPYRGEDLIVGFTRIIFLELKGDKGKQSPEQGAFQKLVEAQGAEYHIIKSIEELESMLETTPDAPQSKSRRVKGKTNSKG